MAVQNDKAQSPATLMDVAKEAQVSIATASRVLNGSTRKVRNQSYVKVMEAATKLNYRPNAYAQAVAKGTAPNIVLLVSDISDPYFASVSQGVVKAAAERGISVTIGVAATPHEELEAVRKSVSTRPRGIIISESEYTDAPERQALQTELTQYEASGGRAVFVLNRNLPFPAVDVANDVGARAIAKLIVDSGYTRPAILKGDDAHRSSKERLAGVMEVLDEAGITVDPKAVANGKFSRTDGYAARHANGPIRTAEAGRRRTVRRQRHRFNHRAQRRDGHRCDDRVARQRHRAGSGNRRHRFRRHPLLRRRVSATDHRASAAGRNGPGRRGQHPVQPR